MPRKVYPRNDFEKRKVFTASEREEIDRLACKLFD